MGASASFHTEEIPEKLTAANIRDLVNDKTWDKTREAKFKGYVINNVATGTIEDTMAAVSNITSKPKMREKLLKRPPFRFVKDIIYNVSKETKYMDNIFATDDVMSGKAFSNKASKQIFLQQAMDLVSEELGMNMPTQPKKVCAGVEVEKTRQFLQLFCYAAQRLEPTITKAQFLEEVARYPARKNARDMWKKAFRKVRLMVKLNMSISERFKQRKRERMLQRESSPGKVGQSIRMSPGQSRISKLWSTNSQSSIFQLDEDPDPMEFSFESPSIFDKSPAPKDSMAAFDESSDEHDKLPDTDTAPPTPALASAAVQPSDFAPRLVKNLHYILERRKKGAPLPASGLDITVLAGCEAKHIIKGKSEAFRKAEGRLWLRKSQIETALFEPGLAENFDTQMVWPAGMGLTRVGSVDVAVESFSKVRKSVQAAKARPLTLHFDLSEDFKSALAKANEMDDDALAAHLKSMVQKCLPILCRPLDWKKDAAQIATELRWACSAQIVHNITAKHDDWGNYCNVLFEATTAQALQWTAQAMRYIEEALAIESQDLASGAYRPGISLSDKRINKTTAAVVNVMSKQALWNLNDLDDTKEPNMLVIQDIARKRLASNETNIEQRYTSSGWSKSVGNAIPSRASRPRQNGVGLVPTPVRLFTDAEAASDGDVTYLCLLSMLAIAFKGPLTAAVNSMGGFKLPRNRGESVQITSFSKMLLLLSTEHSSHKEPRGASNTGLLTTTRCFSSVEELLAGYKQLTKFSKVLRCINGYKEDAEPPVDQPAGSRSICAVVQFTVPSGENSKAKTDIGTLMRMPGTIQACEEWEDSPMMEGWEDRVGEAREFLHSPEVERKPASILVTVELMLEEHGAHRQATRAYHLISKAKNPREMHQYFATF